MKLKIIMRKREDDCDKVQEHGRMMNKYGDGFAWRRGAMLGQGSFGSVYLAITSEKVRSIDSSIPLAIAVKSAELSVSQSIQHEKEVLRNISGCPNVIRYFGEEITTGNDDTMVYNLLLEYASGGSLAGRISKSGDKGLPEYEVRCYTRSILEGLNCIHEVGYVHRDLKPENVLLVPKSGWGSNTEYTAKICDFGMAKRVEKQSEKWKLERYWIGTPMYLSPEAARDGVQDTRSDVWSLGCIVLEMLTGKPAWNIESNILKKLKQGNQLPKIPRYLSQNARNFLECCLERNVSHRLSAKTLLAHPFIEALNDDDEEGDEIEEEKKIGHMDDWRSPYEEQSCCFQTPLQNRQQYQCLNA